MKKIMYKTVKSIKKASPTILTCVSACCSVASVVSAVRNTPKAMRLLETKKLDKGDDLTKVDILRATWKCYLPTVVFTSTSIGCMLTANILNKKMQASIIGAYGLLSQSYKDYKKAANEVFGEGADKKIEAQKAKDVFISGQGIVRNNSLLDYKTDLDTVLFYEPFSNTYFESTLTKVINAQYHINRNLHIRGEVSLDEYYDFLGIKPERKGNYIDIGWSIDNIFDHGLLWFDFSNDYTELEDGMFCYIINYVMEPTLLYEED